MPGEAWRGDPPDAGSGNGLRLWRGAYSTSTGLFSTSTGFTRDLGFTSRPAEGQALLIVHAGREARIGCAQAQTWAKLAPEDKLLIRAALGR